MGKKCFVMALAVFALGFGTALRSNAGTDMIEPYRAPAPSYNYAPPPPPRPVFYVPPPPVRVGVVIGPGYGYYGPRYGFYGSRRFYGRQAYWRGQPSSLALTKICVEAAVGQNHRVAIVIHGGGYISRRYANKRCPRSFAVWIHRCSD